MESKCSSCGEALEMQKRLDEVIEKYKGTKGPLIPILHEAQDIYGYLPFEVQLRIAEGLNIHLADVYGVVTFYTGFSTVPKGKYKINVCLGTACYVKGADAILEEFKTALGIDLGECTEDREFSLDACRCIGSCGLAPAVMINDHVYGNVKVEDVESIIKDCQQKEDK